VGESTTVTIRLSSQTKEQLGALADRTRRPRGVLAAEAIAEYVARELATVGAIEAGQADVRAGRVVPHDDVTRDARVLIEAARAAR
jgi:predicted transcriptional regulator